MIAELFAVALIVGAVGLPFLAIMLPGYRTNWPEILGVALGILVVAQVVWTLAQVQKTNERIEQHLRSIVQRQTNRGQKQRGPK